MGPRLVLKEEGGGGGGTVLPGHSLTGILRLSICPVSSVKCTSFIRPDVNHEKMSGSHFIDRQILQLGNWRS